MKAITNTKEIEFFANKLAMAYIDLPTNVKIVINLSIRQYTDIVPMNMHNTLEVEYNLPHGPQLILKRELI